MGYFVCLLLLIITVSVTSANTVQRPLRWRRTEYEAPILIAVASEEDPDSTDTTQKRLVEYLNFENITSMTKIQDHSGYENDAQMSEDGEFVLIPDSTCKQAVLLPERAEICFTGDTFQAKPRTAITIACWLKLKKLRGFHSIFSTIGSSHPQGQFHFEVDEGVVRWFHRDDKEKVVFESMAESVQGGIWTHVAGTYSSYTKQAKIYINGEIRNLTIGDGKLSRDWNVKACIGHHLNNRPFRGYLDEFRIYNYALQQTEILALFKKCTFKEPPPLNAPLPLAGKREDGPSEAKTTNSKTSSNSGSEAANSSPATEKAPATDTENTSSDKQPAKGNQEGQVQSDATPGGTSKAVTENTATETGSEVRELKTEVKTEQEESNGDNVLKKSEVKAK